MKLTLKHTPIRNLPYWKFYYKGTHSHPVLRTVLVIENHDDWFRGYELREGSIVRMVTDAPIKTYRKDRVARRAELRGDNRLRAEKPTKTTLRKLNRTLLAKEGL